MYICFRVRESTVPLGNTVTICDKHPKSSNKIESFDKEVSRTMPTLQNVFSFNKFIHPIYPLSHSSSRVPLVRLSPNIDMTKHSRGHSSEGLWFSLMWQTKLYNSCLLVFIFISSHQSHMETRRFYFFCVNPNL